MANVDLRHPLVQAKLLVTEKEEKVKVLASNAYSDLEGTIKDMAGPAGCHHVIIDIGMVNDVWDVVEAIVCDGTIVVSNVDLKAYVPKAQVERIVAESYSIPKELLKELEEYSKIEVEGLESYEVVRTLEAPPLPRPVVTAGTAEKIMVEPRMPTDLLTELTGEWSQLKEVTHSIITYLETNDVTDYAVGTGKLAGGEWASVVYLPPEYKPKYEELKSGIVEVVSEHGVRVVYINVGGKEELIKLGG